MKDHVMKKLKPATQHSDTCALKATEWGLQCLKSEHERLGCSHAAYLVASASRVSETSA